MLKTPKSLRLHIGLFGRRNVGKSSLLNAIVRQSVSIVSEIAGTTTDPVEKPMELLPIGPVLFIDTAGIDDIGSLGQMRIDKTKKIIDRTDVAIIVISENKWAGFEDTLLAEFQKRQIPVIVAFNKADLNRPDERIVKKLQVMEISFIETVSTGNSGITELRETLIRVIPDEFINSSTILGDIIGPDKMAVLVVPIDKEAPKGRLILPQVQTIRDLLDSDSYCVVVKESQLSAALSKLTEPPAIVVTDSQAFAEVAADTPDDVPLTSFSILFARLKGDLNEFANGALAIGKLTSGDKVLIVESCTHHPIADDIGRVKIPAWIRQYTGCEIGFDTYQGNDFPENLSDYKLVIQCGGCMTNRRQILSRIMYCRQGGVPITNYGVAIAYTLGIFERALRPFAHSFEYPKQ
ncbi:MAG: [FeFe] hydrogenase H-cluster maturation GTPase HydF [Anaerohalosphaeraceae bacterium]|nr:[FeFe] hydrogenase H-cluster maturation GTPase HydF [Anaerohalosphaeraceae bacterium]